MVPPIMQPWEYSLLSSKISVMQDKLSHIPYNYETTNDNEGCESENTDYVKVKHFNLERVNVEHLKRKAKEEYESIVKKQNL